VGSFEVFRAVQLRILIRWDMTLHQGVSGS